MQYVVAMAVAIAMALAVLVPATAAESGTYADAMKACGAEWKASEARKSVKKGEGMAAWQAFRAECTKRVGYTSKRRGQVGGAVETSTDKS